MLLLESCEHFTCYYDPIAVTKPWTDTVSQTELIHKFTTRWYNVQLLRKKFMTSRHMFIPDNSLYTASTSLMMSHCVRFLFKTATFGSLNLPRGPTAAGVRLS